MSTTKEALHLDPDRLREMREARYWRREEVAVRAGLSAAAIGHYEVGRRSPRLKTLERLADVFGVDVGELAHE